MMVAAYSPNTEKEHAGGTRVSYELGSKTQMIRTADAPFPLLQIDVERSPPFTKTQSIFTMKLTRELINKGESSNGGWSKKQLALLGIDWPPEPGWPLRLEGVEIPDADYAEFVRIKDAHIKPPSVNSRPLPLKTRTLPYICPICEKPTGFDEAEIRYPKGLHAIAKISEGNYRWKCAHCGAWHRENSPTVLK